MMPVEALTASATPGMYFNHDAGGGSDGKRYTRDATILEQSCAEEPNNPRPHFYLAQTYNSLRRNSDAIRAYIKRISMTNGWMEENFMSALEIAEIMRRISMTNGWMEENFMSALHIADMMWSQLESGREVDTQFQLKAGRDVDTQFKLESGREVDTQYQLESGKEVDTQVADYLKSWTSHMYMRDPTLALVMRAYAAAHEIAPYRQEPLKHLAALHRTQCKDYTSCYNMARMARSLGPAPTTALFVDGNVYTYGVLDEMCVCGYYAGHYREGAQACQDLVQVLEQHIAANDALSFAKSMLDRTQDAIKHYIRKMDVEEQTTGTATHATNPNSMASSAQVNKTDQCTAGMSCSTH
eukprot:gene27959-8841_t